MAGDLVLEILDFNWNRLALSPNVVSARKTDELGLVGDATCTIPMDDPAILYIPDPNSTQSYEGRWRLWQDGEIQFAGVIDDTNRNIGGDDTFTFGGKHRGILLGSKNIGRREFNGWPLPDLYRELLRDNIGKAPLSAVISGSSVYPTRPAINAITGDVAEGSIDTEGHTTNVWEAAATGPNFIIIDLGDQKNISGIRVIPPWWEGRWYTFKVETSTNNSTYTIRGVQTQRVPLPDRGKLFEFTTTARYVKVTVTDSTDHIARLNQVLVYEDQAAIGADTDFVVPWIENDDSGNITVAGTTTRIVEQGAFNGDGNGYSFVTRLGSGGSMTHHFRGTGDAAFLTQGDAGGTCVVQFVVDGGTPSTPVTIPADTFQEKGFEILDLAPGDHTLTVLRVSGTPQMDYFSGLLESSYRPIEDDDRSIGFFGGWAIQEHSLLRRQFAHRTILTGSLMYYEFKGDKISIVSQSGPTMGKFQVYIDGVLDSTVDLYSPTIQYQVIPYTWTGTYAYHNLTVRVTGTKNVASSGTAVVMDGVQGNFAHTIFMQSAWDNNIRMLTDLSEIANSWLRYNNDGSVDMLGSVGETSNTIIREGENEGGTIISADTTNDYSESCSAIIAIVSNDNNLPPTKVFLIDEPAVRKMGVKIRVAQHANSKDPIILVRQAWAELQEFKKPVRRFTVSYDDGDVGPILVGETTILYSPRLNLAGDEMIRVGRLTTEWNQNA